MVEFTTNNYLRLTHQLYNYDVFILVIVEGEINIKHGIDHANMAFNPKNNIYPSASFFGELAKREHSQI